MSNTDVYIIFKPLTQQFNPNKLRPKFWPNSPEAYVKFAFPTERSAWKYLYTSPKLANQTEHYIIKPWNLRGHYVSDTVLISIGNTSTTFTIFDETKHNEAVTTHHLYAPASHEGDMYFVGQFASKKVANKIAAQKSGYGMDAEVRSFPLYASADAFLDAKQT